MPCHVLCLWFLVFSSLFCFHTGSFTGSNVNGLTADQAADMSGRTDPLSGKSKTLSSSTPPVMIIAGGVVAALAVFAVIVGIYLVVRKHKRSKADLAHQQMWERQMRATMGGSDHTAPNEIL